MLLLLFRPIFGHESGFLGDLNALQAVFRSENPESILLTQYVKPHRTKHLATEHSKSNAHLRIDFPSTVYIQRI